MPTQTRLELVELRRLPAGVLAPLTASTYGSGELLRAALDAVEDYCRTGRHLLTLAAPPDVAAYRRWVFDEFERQIAGGAPVPWSPAMVGSDGTADLGSARGGHA